MKFRHIATSALLAASFCTFAATGDTACATLVGTANSAHSQSFQLRDGEPVDLVSGTKTVHGKLLVFVDGGTYHAYWQPENSPEKYVLADAGSNSVRLISTPTQAANLERRSHRSACCRVRCFNTEDQTQATDS